MARFLIGLWSLFGVLSIPIVIVETYGIVLAVPLLPTFGILRRKKLEGKKNAAALSGARRLAPGEMRPPGGVAKQD